MGSCLEPVLTPRHDLEGEIKICNSFYPANLLTWQHFPCGPCPEVAPSISWPAREAMSGFNGCAGDVILLDRVELHVIARSTCCGCVAYVCMRCASSCGYIYIYNICE